MMVQVPIFDLLKLLDVLGIDSISFRVLNEYDEGFIRVDYLEEALQKDGWSKVYNESEDPNYCCGNFDVEYANNGYKIILRCDEDGYVFQITINKVT
ncbi:hypothetical protein [Saccharolobus shibatae]|uniref:Uncharacterized protein E-96 n=2 Tax=root TaxID=1 RepID=E96_SSV1|nr:hypothetical protein [Saccharolobus shibatae]NP_039785.1 ORF E-96 [Sulfolobus spindle-shaped virus 1]P20219.1 RecName: Full=Uncharacterized protein E-96 [Sulfolobus spindle-shaped virus 1]CAA30218.1 ORF E-96 [Sulfolobus spindle-shaped virus 1]